MDLVSGLNIYCIVFMHESDAKVKYSDIRIYICNKNVNSIIFIQF